MIYVFLLYTEKEVCNFFLHLKIWNSEKQEIPY